MNGGMKPKLPPGFLSVFCPNEIVWIIEGTSTYPCAKHVANEGVWGHAPPGNLEFGPFIRHNLVESWTVFA